MTLPPHWKVNPAPGGSNSHNGCRAPGPGMNLRKRQAITGAKNVR